ncbi:MAG: hypothetical protein ACK5N8_03690 [Alphaproteobacteria bacterium]
MENLEVALGLIIGLSGFIVFCLFLSFSQKRSKVYLTLMGLFGFLAISSIGCLFYRDLGLFFGYKSLTILLVLTAVYTFLLICVFGGLLYLYMYFEKKYKVSKAAKSLNMNIEEYKQWKQKQLEEIASELN